MDLSEDFQAYVEQNTRRRKRAIIYLWTAAFLTILSSIFAILLLLAPYWGYAAQLPKVTIPGPRKLVQLNSADTALNLANFSLNFVVASIARYWFLRQDKLTTLLAEALVIENENETAIKLLLNQKIG